MATGKIVGRIKGAVIRGARNYFVREIEEFFCCFTRLEERLVLLRAG